MVFTLGQDEAGLRIRREILDGSGFRQDGALALHCGEGAIVLLKEKMTAKELVDAVGSLEDLGSELLVHLRKVCGPCGSCRGGCPCLEDLDRRYEFSDSLLERAGIPKGARLEVRAGDGELIFSEARGPGLWDVPRDLLDLFRESDICLDELDALLAGGDAVYGG